MVRRGGSMPGAVSRVRSNSESHMRSLSSLPASWSRRGLTVVGAAMLALTTGCDFILGVPGVDRVVVATSPADSMPAQTQGQATATVYGKNDKTASGPLENPVHPTDLLATIYHAVGLDPATLVYNHLNQPREIVQGSVVSGIFA